VSENEKKLGQSIVSLYKLVRIQQEVIADLMLRATAFHHALAVSPDLQAAMNKNLVEMSPGESAQTLRETLQDIDSSIASLQQTFGPWEN
jgi:hypothetical protein